MICIEKIEIEKFRGIRALSLDLKKENFGICGPNGTGKSGVVDAIEFALTGNVSRLSGRGTGGLSVRSHAPHVKERNEPKLTKVTLTVHIPSLSKFTTITRTVATPSDCTFDPDGQDVRAALEKVSHHPEFALSRREIIRYILAEPNRRATDVQELLRLDEIEQTRKHFTKVANSMHGVKNTQEQVLARERRDLLQTLELDEWISTAILEVINARREVLSLPLLEKLESETSFKEGMLTASKSADAPVKKTEAAADIEQVNRTAISGENESTAVKRRAALEDIRVLIADAAALRRFKQQSLIKAGINLVENDACPLCDTEWQREELLKHLQAKLQSAEHASELLSKLNSNLNHIVGEMNAYIDVIGRIITWSTKLKPALNTEALSTHKHTTEKSVQTLRDFIAEKKDIDAVKSVLVSEWWNLSKEAKNNLNTCASVIAKLPEVSDENKAQEFLTIADEKYRRVVKARLEFDTANTHSKVAARVLGVYQERSDAILETLYDEVADDFTEYYRSLNQEDESDFEGKLTPSAAKLGFDVDFYGYGKFPPGAYHSEGHQDGMGLCLYLALMKRTLGDKFTFCVLDDVLMSIDAGHRREVCKLLKRKFPNTQFILTTHDKVWLKFMQTEGLIKNSRTFSGWTVDTGPRVWRHLDVWDEIEESLQKDDVENAAAILRRYLEYISNILADSLQAEVRFKGNGQYDLGDLMPAIIQRWRKKISDAIQAAKSWNEHQEEGRLCELLGRINDAQKRKELEQWMVNPLVHYNDWANLQVDEFRSIVKAFFDILATMRCETCEGYVELQPRNTTAETIRCDCGKFFINLRRK